MKGLAAVLLLLAAAYALFVAMLWARHRARLDAFIAGVGLPARQ